jgi:hypothetical protein
VQFRGGHLRRVQGQLLRGTREGNVTRDSAGRPVSFLISDATVSTGRTSVKVSVDGQLMVAWLDASEGRSNLLKVARRRLDCGQ